MSGGSAVTRQAPVALAIGLCLLIFMALPAFAQAAPPTTLSLEAVGLPKGTAPSIVLTGPRTHKRITTSKRTFRNIVPGRYVLTVGTVTVSRATRGVRRGARVYALHRHIEVEVRGGQPNRVKATYAAAVNPGVRPAPHEILKVLGDAQSPSGLELPGSAQVPAPGTIFSSGPTASLPVGLLARVTASRRAHGRTVVSLAPADIQEAVPELAYEGSLPLTPSGGASSESGGSIPAQAARVKAHESGACKPPSLVHFGAHLDSVEIRQAFLGAWPPQMKLTLAVRTTETLGLDAAAAGINCDWQLGEIGPYSAGIPVGPVVVPVYATLPINASVHINGTLQAGALNLASTTVAHVAAGFDEQAATLSEQGTNVWTSGVLALSGSANLSASIGVQAGVGIAKGANLHAEADFGPAFEWSSGNECELLVDLGSLSAGVEVFGHSFNSPAYTPFKLHLWKGCKPPPAPAPTPPVQPPAPKPPPAPPPVPTNGPTLVDSLDTAMGSQGGDLEFSEWEAATGEHVELSGGLPPTLSGYRCVVLLANRSLEAGEAAGLSSYLNAGGTIVAIGEHAGYGFDEADTTLNELASRLGVGLALNDDEVDYGEHETGNISPSPLTANVYGLGDNWASTLTVSGAAQALAESAEESGPILGAQAVGQGEFLMAGDSNMFSDNSYGAYYNADNGQLVRDICP